MRWSLVLAFTCLAGSLVAAGRQELAGGRLSSPPNLDGRVLEEEWAEAASGSGLHDAETGSPEPYATRFWIGYDDRYVYFAAQADDPTPGKIKADEYRNNANLKGNDLVGVVIDPFGTLADFNEFEMNASGGTAIRIAGGRAPKREWVGEIAAKGRRTEKGWEVEARIPWEILRLPEAGPRTVRINVYRYVSRDQRTYRWCDTRNGQVGNMARWEGVRIPPVDRRRAMKLLPFLYAGYEDEAGVLDGGLDAKMSLTGTLEAIATVRPDFRNIENDILSLDFSYFQRLTNESRPFFLEGAEYLKMGNDQKIFASQRVGSFDVGAKVFGKADAKTTVSALGLSTFGEETLFVAGVGRRFDDKTNVNIGAVLQDGDANDHRAAMVQVNRLVGATNLYFGTMLTDDSERGYGQRTNVGGFYSGGGLSAYGEYVEVSPDFFPRVGFSPEQDLKGANWRVDYTRPTRRHGLSEAGLTLSGVSYTTFGGDRYRDNLQLSTSTTWQDGLDLDLTYTKGTYFEFDDETFRVSIEKPRRDPYRRWQLDCVGGRLGGSDYQTVVASFLYRPWQRLQLSFRHQWVQQDGVREQTIFSATWDLGHDQSVSGRLVRADDDTNAYLAFRQSGNRGMEYFVVLGDPNASTFQSRLILKVAVPIDWYL
ncbi:MAG: DUF5916 domain-containing protein [Armatimonadetes bacterium]|nr:DUF5916 domain-containing protein [Armatimonadota bacterium]